VPPDVTITVSGVEELPEIAADASKLRQVLVNLLDNAVHAVGVAGRILVQGQTAGQELVLAIEDSGPGIDASIRGRLFEPLITTKAKGIGLGLPLVRRIVERHGGRVAHEVPAGGGARFVVRLPLGS
jgi:signal transduction histidine kinase